MSKQILTILSLHILLGALFSGCIVELNRDSDSIRGQGPVIQEIRSTGAFTGVQFALDGDLVIEPGVDSELRIDAQENILNYIDTFVRDGILYIETERDISLRPTEPIRFSLSTPELQSVSLVGSGDVQTGTWEVPAFALSVAGSGDLFVQELTTETLNVSIVGSGDVDIAGSTNTQEISIAGSGDYNARQVASKSAFISIAGSGDSFVQVSEELTASITGSGSVYYLGSPVITSSILGSGQVRMINN